MTSFLGEQTVALTEYSETLVRRLIEKIRVYDEKLVVEFKSGLTVEVGIIIVPSITVRATKRCKS